jgi:small subunit ribosomal protein S20
VFRAAARTYIKKSRKLMAQGDLEGAELAARDAIQTLDKAARKGVVHPRNAARRKSRLMKALNEAKEAA